MSTTRDEISALVRAHIDEEMQYLTDPDATYSDEDNLRDVVGLDELDFLEILMHLEEELTIEMPDQDYSSVVDFVDAVELLV